MPKERREEGMMYIIVILIVIAVSWLTTKIVTIKYFNVIDGYVKGIMDDTAKAVGKVVDKIPKADEDAEEIEAFVAANDGKNFSTERCHTVKALREAVMPLLDERVISVDITKRAP